MPAIIASAPGKVILVGEHAVVYHRPAIAVPVHQIQAKASVFAEIRGQPGEVWVEAPNIGLSARLSNLPASHAFTKLFAAVARELSISRYPALRLKVSSTIPIAAGLGSGAAVSVAIIRALSAFLGHPLPEERVSALAFDQEKIYHGTPSGIDNTVIAYAQPIFFVRDRPFELIYPADPIHLVICDTGLRSSTSQSVAGVRQRWQADPVRYDHIFDRIGNNARQARADMEAGNLQNLGDLMDQNHQLLQEIGVSCPELDRLVEAAKHAGALGAKLCGGGLGGNMIALVEDPAHSESVAAAIRGAGAVRSWITQIPPKSAPN